VFGALAYIYSAHDPCACGGVFFSAPSFFVV
jgi:hypothetical protein